MTTHGISRKRWYLLSGNAYVLSSVAEDKKRHQGKRKICNLQRNLYEYRFKGSKRVAKIVIFVIRPRFGKGTKFPFYPAKSSILEDRDIEVWLES